MGRAARLLGFDVDFAPVLDLAQPGTGAVVLEGRCFGFHAGGRDVSRGRSSCTASRAPASPPASSTSRASGAGRSTRTSRFRSSTRTTST